MSVVECHPAVQQIVRIAEEFNVVIIPYGGGTSVSGSVSCPQEELRPVLALDTTQMVIQHRSACIIQYCSGSVEYTQNKLALRNHSKLFFRNIMM